MGTGLRSGVALQEALDPSQESSWDLALALGFGELWESWDLNETIPGEDSCFLPDDKLGSAWEARWETGGGRGCNTALVLRLHPQRQGSETWGTEGQSLFPDEWQGRAPRLLSASHLDSLGCQAFLKGGNCRSVEKRLRRMFFSFKCRHSASLPQYSTHSASFWRKLSSSGDWGLDRFYNRVSLHSLWKESGIESWQGANWGLRIAVSQRSFQRRDRGAKGKEKKRGAFRLED